MRALGGKFARGIFLGDFQPQRNRLADVGAGFLARAWWNPAQTRPASTSSLLTVLMLTSARRDTERMFSAVFLGFFRVGNRFEK